MKNSISLTLLLVTLFFWSCGGDKPSAEDLAAEAEAERMEAAAAALENSIEGVEASAEELINALDSLEVLFPEKND